MAPVGLRHTLWTAPGPDLDPDIYSYNAKAHPHLSQPGELIISYNVNTFDFADHFAHAGIYRPRFIRVRLPQWAVQRKPALRLDPICTHMV